MAKVLNSEPLTITIDGVSGTFVPVARKDGRIVKLLRRGMYEGLNYPQYLRYSRFVDDVNLLWAGQKLFLWRNIRKSKDPVEMSSDHNRLHRLIEATCARPEMPGEHFTDEDYKPLPDVTIAAMRNADYSELEQRHAAAYNLDFTQMGPGYEELGNQVADHIERAQKEFPEYLEKAYEDFRTGRIAPVSLAGRPHKTTSFSTPTRRGDDQLLKRFLTENGMTEQPEVAIEALDTVKSSFGVSFAEVRQQHQDMLKAESKGRRYRAVWESPVDKKLTFAVIGISLLAHIGLLVFTAYRDGVPFWSLL